MFANIDTVARSLLPREREGRVAAGLIRQSHLRFEIKGSERDLFKVVLSPMT